MLISQALAASETPAATTAETAVAPAPATEAPSAGDAFMSNMGLIGVMFILFYFLLIRPQQKRLKAQQTMLGGLKVGDRIVTGGGIIGNISRIINDTEVEIDLGNGLRVTALRYTLTARPLETK